MLISTFQFDIENVEIVADNTENIKFDSFSVEIEQKTEKNVEQPQLSKVEVLFEKLIEKKTVLWEILSRIYRMIFIEIRRSI